MRRGPVAVILAEDDVEIASTVDHHRELGFATIILLHPGYLSAPADADDDVHRVVHDTLQDDALPTVVNRLVRACPSPTWFYAGYNAEYLYFPFCESRPVEEALRFHAEEHRAAMPCCVVDLYADDLASHPNAVSTDSACFDSRGYFALAAATGRDRELDLFGGLKWRFEQHVPADRRRIDRISLFRSRRGLRMTPDFRFNAPEYNTSSSPWHHNLTAAVCSFRTAKALRTNPASMFDIKTFRWFASERFAWSSEQLMQRGLMEPGQWF